MEGEVGCEVAVDTRKDVADAHETIFFFRLLEPSRGEEAPAGGLRLRARLSSWASRCVNLLWQ